MREVRALIIRCYRIRKQPMDDSALAALLEEHERALLDPALSCSPEALCTYRVTTERHSSLRSSVSVHEDSRWKLRFHQGTRTPA